MTWTIQIDGHDNLEQELKESFENGLVAKVTELVDDIRAGAGITITRANVTTNTTGSVDLPVESTAPESTEGEEPAPA